MKRGASQSPENRKHLEVKVGNIVIPIYQFTDGRYCVDTVIAGKRKRITRASLEDAKVEANRLITQIRSGRSEEVPLTISEVEDYRLSKQKLEGYNRSLLSVVEEWIEEQKKRQFVVAKNVPDIVGEFVQAKTSDGLSKFHIADCQARLKKFGKAFPGRIDRITTAEVSRWLAKLEGARRTKKNYRDLVLQLFRYARTHQYLPAKEATVVEEITITNVQEGEILIYTPAELALYLRHAPARLIPFIAIGAFAGLRSQEIMRLEWKDIRFDEGFIEISAKKAKTASRRLVPLLPVLKDWLHDHRKSSGRVMEYSHNAALTRARLQFCAKGYTENGEQKPFVWKPNALRHSFASYRLAEIKDAARVALEMGNSPTMLFRNYRELVTEPDARKWFSLLRQTVHAPPAEEAASSSAPAS